MTKKESKSSDSRQKMNKEDIHFLKRIYLKSEIMHVLLTDKIVSLIKDECKSCDIKENCWKNMFFGLTITDEGVCQNKNSKPFVPEFQDCSNH